MASKNKYSFSTAALYPRSAAESLRLIAEAGFSHAELMPQCFADARENFAKAAEKSGTHVASIHYPLAMFSMLYNSSEGMVQEARRFGNELVRLCSALGTEVLVIHPHEMQKDPILKQRLEEPIRDNILLLAEACETAGLILAIENSPKGVGRSPEGLLSYIASLGNSKVIKPAIDTTEACEAGIDPAEFIIKAKPAHLHLSDHAGNEKHIPAGEGENDWHAIKRALERYQGYYTLEPLYRYYIDEPEKKLAKAFEFLAGLFEGNA